MTNIPDTDAVAGPSLALDSEKLAHDYDRISAQRQFLAGQQLVEQLDIKPGERVLDVGCGTGLLAEYIAGLTGASGYVLGIDPLPLRIGLAGARVRPGLEFRVGDAYDLTALPTAGFDVICLNAVFHWLPEKTGPLREFLRLLKSGGRLGIGTGLGHGKSSVREAMARVLAQPPFSDFPYPQSGVFRVTEQQLADLLRAAGFAAVSLDLRRSVRSYESAEELIRFSEASSFGNLFGYLPDQHRPAARAALRQALEEIARGEVLRDERIGLIAIGIKP
jgi:arsenite methyltransferase